MLGKKNAVRLRRLLDVMIPILITQTAIMAMNFCDSAMSGHAGAVHLAGTAIGGNLWMPVMASLNGILLGSMPIIAHLLGRGERQNIGRVVRHTMLLATAFSLLLLVAGVLFLDRLLGTFGLEPQVHYIAKMYIAAIGAAVLFIHGAACTGRYQRLHGYYHENLPFGAARKCIFKLLPYFRQIRRTGAGRHWRWPCNRHYLLAGIFYLRVGSA